MTTSENMVFDMQLKICFISWKSPLYSDFHIPFHTPWSKSKPFSIYQPIKVNQKPIIKTF